MKEKIIAALKTKFKNLGFGDKAFDGVAEFLEKTVTKEEDIETAVSGVEPLLKSFQGDIDKRVNDAVAKAKADNDKKDPGKKDEADPNEPGWFKTYREKVDAETTALKQKLDAFESKETQANLTQKVRDKLKEKGVTDSFLKRQALTVKDEADIDRIVDEIKSDFDADTQERINQKLVTAIPSRSTPADTKAEMDSFLKEKFPDIKS